MTIGDRREPPVSPFLLWRGVPVVDAWFTYVESLNEHSDRSLREIETFFAVITTGPWVVATPMTAARAVVGVVGAARTS